LEFEIFRLGKNRFGRMSRFELGLGPSPRRQMATVPSVPQYFLFSLTDRK
jgi:hypothetical protein